MRLQEKPLFIGNIKIIKLERKTGMTITEIISLNNDYSFVNNTFDKSLYLKRVDSNHYGLFNEKDILTELFDKEKALANLPQDNWEYNSNNLKEIQKEIKIGKILQSHNQT